MLKKIISGAQTGSDRGGLDAAIALGLEQGGHCPKGRRAEDGRIPDIYKVEETISESYPVRTELNILNSDATLIFVNGNFGRGTQLTVELVEKHGCPYWVIDLDKAYSIAGIRRWLVDNHIECLNVAGSRESGKPGIQKRVCQELIKILEINAY